MNVIVCNFIVNIDVFDLVVVEMFYLVVFGLCIGCWFGIGVVELFGGLILFYLLQNEVGSVVIEDGDVCDYECYWILLYLDWVVEDIDVVLMCVVVVGVMFE